MADEGARTSGQSSSTELEDAYQALSRRLQCFFRSKGIGREDAADLAQEAISRTVLHLKRHGATRDDIEPLVRTIARNLYVERVRRSTPPVVALTEAASVQADTPSPADALVAAEDREEIRAAIRALAPRHRRVIDLSMEGLSPGEIARHLGIKRNAVDALLHRARRSLASKLETGRSRLGAFAGLLATRVRLSLGRLSSALPRPDSIAAVSGVATTLTSIVLATALTLSPSGHHRGGAIRAMASRSGGAIHGIARDEPPFVGGRPRMDARSSPTVIVTDLRQQHAAAHADAPDPSGQGSSTWDVDIWHRRDPGNRGTVGPVLDEATAGVCGSAGHACSEVGP